MAPNQTIDDVYRDNAIKNDPHSGAHEPDKPEIRALLKQIQNSGGQAVTRNTLAALNGVTPPTELYGGVVLSDPNPANNGYYSRDGGAWVKGRGFPDTFARVALSGSGTAQAGAVESGVNPADAQVFFAIVTTPNTGPMTLAVGGEAPRPVLNLAGNPLSAGEWAAVVLFVRDGENYRMVIAAGAEAAAAQSASDANAAREAVLSKVLGSFSSDATATAAAGGDPAMGTIYYNSVDGQLRAWNGSTWQDWDTSLANGAVSAPKLTSDGPGLLDIKEKIGAVPAENYVSNAIWTPPSQTAASAYIDTATAGYNEFLALWEGIRTANPGWVSRASMGKDASGAYDIWKYTFQPEGGYDRTVVVGCNIHGGEIMSQLAPYLFFKQLENRWREDSFLGFARQRVRWIVVPMVNPWGVSQSPRLRQNSNGVDLNRNFDYRWFSFGGGGTNPFDYDYRGTSAASEPETQYYQELASTYPTATAIVDMHSYASPSGADKYIVYGPDFPLRNARQDVVKLISELIQPNETFKFGSNGLPSAFNYFADRGFNSSNPEWAFLDGPQFGPTDMTEALRWYGNFLLMYATGRSAKQVSAGAPFIRRYRSNANIPVGINTSPQSVLPLDVFTIDGFGVLEMHGAATLIFGATAGRVVLKNTFGQDALWRGAFLASNGEAVTDFVASGGVDERVTVPFYSAIPVGPHAPIRFQPAMYCVAGAASLARFDAYLKFTPSDGVSFRAFSSSSAASIWGEIWK
ncbi:M14 family metallopeptidase [Devosia sp. YIM 151766]|uniref:M14 family metallopeptidase n=1 Tax=Devosia sp. YIM 151766 TaxID=3017325 RepID=UPI00255CED88|nr:M14 family metallopeptidase [Devosia sp. YIM 151766]WIY54163.1 M14 family metallopeptidase [Devosia sp. YIM 151766]